MATKTTNYGLTKPAPTDLYDITVPNANMDVIDEELKKVNDTLDGLKSFTKSGNPVSFESKNPIALSPTVEFTAHEVGIGTKARDNPYKITGLDNVYVQTQTGNRNLLLNSSEEYVSGETCHYGYWDLGKETYEHGIILEPDQTYTISFDWSVNWANIAPTAIITSIGCAKSPGGYSLDINQRTLITEAQAETTTSGRCSLTFTPTKEQVETAPYFAIRYIRTSTELALDGTTWTLTNLKLEKSASESDYTPAPEDNVASDLMTETAWCEFPFTMYGAKVDFARGKWWKTWNVYILDGTEAIERLEHNGTMRFFIHVPNPIRSKYANTGTGVCSHFAYGFNPISQNDFDNMFAVYATTGNVYGRCDGIESVEAMQTFLAEQYAAGTPVTIAYLLEEPIEYDFTPKVVNAVGGEGVNTVYTNGDTLEVVYDHDKMFADVYGSMAVPTPVSRGGTGASTVETALMNLGIQIGKSETGRPEKESTVDVPVTFPIPYAEGTVPTVVINACHNQTSYHHGKISYGVVEESVTNTGFTGRIYNSSSYPYNMRFTWMAIGVPQE